jgi:hypothetical protein
MGFIPARFYTNWSYAFGAYFFPAVSGGYLICKNQYLDLPETKMNKKLILGLALVLVLVSGAFISVLAAEIAPSCWAGFCPAPATDMDRPDAPCQGAYRYGPTTPDPMGSPG